MEEGINTAACTGTAERIDCAEYIEPAEYIESAERIDPAEYLRQWSGTEKVDIRTYSPLTLAFIGDGIYELVIRTLLVQKGNRSVQEMHKQKSRLVRAAAQAAMAEAVLAELSAEEESVYRRGRNATTHSTAKNASVADYRKATGFEALCGYLYLNGQLARLMELIGRAFEELSLTV